MRSLRIVFLLGSLVGLIGCAVGAETVDITLGREVFQIELATTYEARARGLMFRKELPPDSGMLFIFEKDQNPSFWMKNTFIPLSLAFISRDGTIREIHDMTPGSLRPITSRYSVRFALEVLQGAFSRAGVDVGDRIQFPERVLRYVR